MPVNPRIIVFSFVSVSGLCFSKMNEGNLAYSHMAKMWVCI